MSATTLVNALRRHRDGLASRWCKRFADNGGGDAKREKILSQELVLALVDEVISLIAAEGRRAIPRRHRGCAFTEMAPFPENVALCIDCFQAGAQVIGSFIVEHAGPFALWSVRERNRHLGALDASFHILVHREIETVCEQRLDGSSEMANAIRETAASHGLRRLSAKLVGRN